ncbi:hypothetical protein [Streptomyces laurentii]|uniref:hypothetical protein n=1 Tax=Streptomyces laurentii TaxID=39478 RepID=UPI00368C62AB
MRSDALRDSAILATAAVTVLASTACGATPPTAVTPKAVRHSELVGRWDGEAECGAPLPVFRLRDDYTFSAKDYPVEWDGPGPDSRLTRRSAGGKWHAVNEDPGLPPYLVLRFGKDPGAEFLPFTVDNGKLRADGSVTAGGGDPYVYACHYTRTSTDPESDRSRREKDGLPRPAGSQAGESVGVGRVRA